MTKFIKRKDFENIFLPIERNGKNIWAIHRVKKLAAEIVDIAIQLSALDFIKNIRLTDDSISASSEIEGKRIKVPVTKTNSPTATGIKILYDHKFQIIDFDEINSPTKGNGGKMVDAVLCNLPKDWKPGVAMDWSNGFWNKMKEKYPNLE